MLSYQITTNSLIAMNSKNFGDNLQIKNMFSIVARPQANGQVEAINKTIKHNLKTKLEDMKGRWVDELPEVLWACKTSVRTPTRETSFSLAYGYETIVLVEIRAGSLRRENYVLDQNLILLRRELNSSRKSDVINNCESQLINVVSPNTSTPTLSQ